MRGGAVQVDHQPRISGQDRRRIQGFGQNFGHCLGPDVVCDMAVEMLGLQPQVPHGLRHAAAGMIAGQNQGRPGVGIDAPGDGGFVGGEQAVIGGGGKSIIHGFQYSARPVRWESQRGDAPGRGIRLDNDCRNGPSLRRFGMAMRRQGRRHAVVSAQPIRRF